jgi:hypothetical protein
MPAETTVPELATAVAVQRRDIVVDRASGYKDKRSADEVCGGRVGLSDRGQKLPIG